MRESSIKDTVHGYIELDRFERWIVDSPWFQRLRRVKQNDVSSFVYPTMQATRFEHSLGAMHLAGECVRAAIDADETADHSKAFLEEVRAEVSHVFGVNGVDARILAIRAARLYGLLHDIGHPPFSHLAESCFTAAQIGMDSSAGSSWHEANGAEIVMRYLPVHIAEMRRRTSQVSEAAFEDLLIKLSGSLAAKSVRSPALVGLKSLVDAVIDVDRMDFVLRDGKTSGAEFGVYDTRRLIESFRVHVERDKHTQVRAVYIRPSHKALSAIESLLQERYKIYRWVHFHHRVIQAKALMRFALANADMFFASGQSPLDPTNFRAERYVRTDVGATYALLGDSYIEQYLDRALVSSLQKPARDHLQARVQVALKILVLREDLGISLWKRAEGYSDGATSFEHYLEHGSDLYSGFGRISDPPNLEVAREHHGSLANWVAAVFRDEGGRPLVQRIVDDLNSSADFDFVLLEASGFKTAAEDKLIIAGENRVKALKSMSTVAQGIATARRGDVHLFAFHFSPNHVTDVAQRERLIINDRQRIAAAIVAAYDKEPLVRKEFDAALRRL